MQPVAAGEPGSGGHLGAIQRDRQRRPLSAVAHILAREGEAETIGERITR